MSVKIANLTPHAINLLVNNDVKEIKPHGFILRVGEKIRVIGNFGGIKIIKKELDDKQMSNEDIEKLKEIAKKYDIIVVSFPAKEIIHNLYKKSILSKEEAEKFYLIGQVIRSEDGKVLYAESLAKII